MLVNRLGEVFEQIGTDIKTISDSQFIKGKLSNYNGQLYNGSFQTGDYAGWANVINPGGVLSFHTDDFPFGSRGCISCKGGYVVHTMPQAIPVNPYMEYRMSIMSRWYEKIKASSSMYAGVACLDVDGLSIAAQHCMHRPNTISTLAQDLSPGDTKIYLTNLSGWQHSGYYYRRGMKFFTYKDSIGYLYKADVMPYTRYYHWGVPNNSSGGLWANPNDLEFTGNSITLRSPWNYPNPNRADGVWPAGTQVAQTDSGGSYNYCVAQAMYNGTTGPTEWKYDEGMLSGMRSDGAISMNKFRPGTAFIKPLFLLNYNNPNPLDEVRISGVYFDRL